MANSSGTCISPNVYNVGSYIRFQIHISVIQWMVERNLNDIGKRRYSVKLSLKICEWLIRLTMERTISHLVVYFLRE